MKSDSTLVTVTTASELMEANIMKSKLQSEGINCFLADEVTIGINPLYSPALGGIRVQVSSHDLELARQILKVEEPRLTLMGCPRCGSGHFKSSSISGILNLLAFLSFGIFVPGGRRLICEHCHHSWKK